MIATQNQTRRAARNQRSDGKAIVGQVGERAIGLMSISSEIEYKFFVINQVTDYWVNVSNWRALITFTKLST